ncbi:MAG: hypothetical protein U1F76_06385 [Candidatus Competibacteraceae bacterium]
MIPIAFRMLHERLAADRGIAALEEARRTADTEAAATLGVSSALAAFGGFFIPITYSAAISLSGGPQPALLFFGAFYLSCVLITGWWYNRQGAEAPCRFCSCFCTSGTSCARPTKTSPRIGGHDDDARRACPMPDPRSLRRH